ncbi:MAG TPA: tetratricopeptide repeat-containing sensor histidine kinase [Pedobacter sp.]|jgi:signal transduction histidine kinase
MITRKSLLFISVLFLCKMVSGQQANIKVLRLEENKQKKDSNEVKWHYELSKAYRRLNADSTIHAAKKGVLLARKINFKKGEGLCYSSLAVGYAIKGMFKEAVENCKKAIEINKVANPSQLATNYSQMGLMVQNQGKMTEAIYYQNLSLKFAERYKDNRVLYQSHNNIGIIYIYQGEYLRANDHFYKALKLAERLNDTMVIATVCINISEIYREQKDYKRALEFSKKALLFNQTLNDAHLKVVAYITNGTIYSKLNDHHRAITHFEKALKVAKESGVESRLGECFTNLGNAYLALEHYEKSLSYLLQAETLDKAENNNTALSGDYIVLSKVYEKTNKPELQVKYALLALKLAQKENLKPKMRDAAESLYGYFKKQGNTSQALFYLEVYTKHKDSLFNAENIKQLKDTEYKFAKESQQKEILLLRNKNELKEQENNLQRTYLYGSFVLCLAAIGFIFYYLREIRIKNKLYESLRQKNEHIQEQSNKLEDLNLIKNKVISVMSHDMRSPIASLEMILNMEKELSDPDVFRIIIKELKPAVNSLSLLLENILGWAKSQMQSTQEIHFEPLNVYNTVEEIITLYTPISSQKSVTLINEVPVEAWVSANQSYLTLILRNLLSNAIKFSPVGESISISAANTEEFITITVADKGIGMTEHQISKLFNLDKLYTSSGTKNEKGTGLGLIFVKESVELCGGKLLIKSKKDKGSQISCQFPIEVPEKDLLVSDVLRT